MELNQSFTNALNDYAINVKESVDGFTEQIKKAPDPLALIFNHEGIWYLNSPLSLIRKDEVSSIISNAIIYLDKELRSHSNNHIHIISAGKIDDLLEVKIAYDEKVVIKWYPFIEKAVILDYDNAQQRLDLKKKYQYRLDAKHKEFEETKVLLTSYDGQGLVNNGYWGAYTKKLFHPKKFKKLSQELLDNLKTEEIQLQSIIDQLTKAIHQDLADDETEESIDVIKKVTSAFPYGLDWEYYDRFRPEKVSYENEITI